jgi:hypothetical protein
MFSKLTKESFNRVANNAKTFLGSAYKKTKNILDSVDHGAKIFKTVYSAIHPYLEKYGQNHLNTNIKKAITGYDTIRNKIENVDNEILNVKNDLTRKGLLKL